MGKAFHKHEDLHSDPQNSHKGGEWWPTHAASVLEKGAETGLYLTLLARQTSGNSKLQTQQETPEDLYSSIPLARACQRTHMHTSVHTHMHTPTCTYTQMAAHTDTKIPSLKKLELVLLLLPILFSVYEFMFMYMWGCTHVWAYAYVCSCMWKLVDTLGCCSSRIIYCILSQGFFLA